MRAGPRSPRARKPSLPRVISEPLRPIRLGGLRAARTQARYICAWPAETLFSNLRRNASVPAVHLSWHHVLTGIQNEGDGENVGYHEFAHVLDAADGHSDGVPVMLGCPSLYRRWVRVLSGELAGVRASCKELTALFPSGAVESEGEFFAYATELFFEMPVCLLARHPALYRLLADYYGQDPAVAT